MEIYHMKRNGTDFWVNRTAYKFLFRQRMNEHRGVNLCSSIRPHPVTTRWPQILVRCLEMRFQTTAPVETIIIFVEERRRTLLSEEIVPWIVNPIQFLQNSDCLVSGMILRIGTTEKMSQVVFIVIQPRLLSHRHQTATVMVSKHMWYRQRPGTYYETRPHTLIYGTICSTIGIPRYSSQLLQKQLSKVQSNVPHTFEITGFRLYRRQQEGLRDGTEYLTTQLLPTFCPAHKATARYKRRFPHHHFRRTRIPIASFKNALQSSEYDIDRIHLFLDASGETQVHPWILFLYTLEPYCPVFIVLLRYFTNFQVPHQVQWRIWDNLKCCSWHPSVLNKAFEHLLSKKNFTDLYG